MVRVTDAAGLNNRRPRRERAGGLLASGAGLIFIKIMNAALGVASVTVFARFLPPENYGVYVLALTVAQFLAMPLQMGLPTLLTREIAAAQAEDRPDVVKGVRTWTHRVLLVGALAIGGLVIGTYAVIVAAGWPVLQTFSWPLILLIAALVPVISEMKRVMGILNGYRRPAQSRMPDGIVRPALLLAIGGGGLWAGWFTETGLLATYLVAALVAAITGWALVGNAEGERFNGQAEVRSAEWWRSLGPLAVFMAAGAVKTYSDILMLGAMHSTESVAFYRIATQIAAVPILVQVAVNAVMSPRIATMNAKQDFSAMQRLAVRGGRIACAATFIATLLLIAIGPSWVVWAFGDDYEQVFFLVALVMAGSVFNTAFGGPIMLLNMTRREDSSARYAVSTALGNILLNLALIPFFGAVGAAIATVSTTLAMQYLAWRRVRLDLGMRTDAFAKVRT